MCLFFLFLTRSKRMFLCFASRGRVTPQEVVLEESGRSQKATFGNEKEETRKEPGRAAHAARLRVRSFAMHVEYFEVHGNIVRNRP